MSIRGRLLGLGASVVLSAALAGVMGGTAWSKGKPVPSPSSGTVTCTNVNGMLVFSPPLQASAATSSAVTLNAQLTKCSGGSPHGKTTGHVSASAGTVASNICANPPTTIPGWSGAAVRWTPSSKVTASTVSFPAGTGSVVGTQLKVSYTGGTVTGSFATASASLTATSKQSVSDLTSACSAGGVSSINFSGSATL